MSRKWYRKQGRCSSCEEPCTPVIEVCASGVGASEWWLCESCLTGYVGELRRRNAGYVKIRCARCSTSHLVAPPEHEDYRARHWCECGRDLDVAAHIKVS